MVLLRVQERGCIGAGEARRCCVCCRADFLCRGWEWTACCAGGRWGGWLGRAVQGRRRGVAGGGFVCAAVSLDQTTEAKCLGGLVGGSWVPLASSEGVRGQDVCRPL